jgi:RNA-directed DNA polymerase
MRAEQRDPALQRRVAANQQWEEPMPEAKPYDIPKQLVRDAYLRVKANRGAAGVDGVSLAAFEKDLKGNLYKVWNRMSSGSYFPPPVRLVEIEKEGGGTRPLGIPTWAPYCTSRSLSLGNARGSGNPLPQLAVSPIGDGDRVGRSRLSLVS